MTATFGVGWVRRERGRDRNPAWDIDGAPVELLEEFSSRSAEIDREKDRLIAAYRTAHGKQPSARTVLRLRAQATLATRPAKQIRSMQDLIAAWRHRAAHVIRTDPVEWAATVTSPIIPATTGRFSRNGVDALAVAVVAAVGEKRPTWHRWNLHAEASRQLKGVRFAGLREREAATRMVVEAAERVSVRLTPPDPATTPSEFQRADGSSVYRPRDSARFTSVELLEAEQRLLDRAARFTAPSVPPTTIARVIRSRRWRLSVDKVDAIEQIAASARGLDLLVGPAGAGKTTAMAALRAAWEEEYGQGSVDGLAPSAVAADILGQELGIPTDNTAKWLHDHAAGLAEFRAGQLIIVDEASLASTRTLEAITRHAEQVGAKVLLVGDWAQLQAVDTGGAFGLLARARDDISELSDVHRFIHGWEKAASIDLRHGRPVAIDAYLTHGRIRGGDTDRMIDCAFEAWNADRAAGKSSVLVAQTLETVRALNDRARAQRILTLPKGVRGEVEIAGGSRASVGDTVITRRNERTLYAGRTGWVRNGNRWTVTRLHRDGGVTVRRAGYRRGAAVRLPRSYVTEHLDIGYAVTGYGAQGVTVDTAHAIVQSGTSREQLYVALTRGRHANTAYVATDRFDPVHEQQHPGQNPDLTAVAVLHGVLRTSAAEQSAHETMTAEQDRWGSIAQLAAEYETIAAAAQHDRWAALVRSTSLTTGEAASVIASSAFGPLCAELRRAEAYRHDVERLLPRLVAARSPAGAYDIAAVLHQRLAIATARPAGSPRARRAPRLVAGLIPEASGEMSTPMRDALRQRHARIESRADAILDRAVTTRALWLDNLACSTGRELPQLCSSGPARAIAAYRERYDVHDADPLGPAVGPSAQQRARSRLQTAVANWTAGMQGADQDNQSRHSVAAELISQ